MYKAVVTFNINILLYVGFLIGCSSNSDYSQKTDYNVNYSKLKVEETLIRNTLALNRSVDNKVILKETHLFSSCSCDKKGKDLKILLRKDVEDNVEKRVSISLGDGVIEDLEVRFVIDQKEGKGRFYRADNIVLSLDTLNNSVLKGEVKFSVTKDEVDQIMTDSFEGKFICELSSTNLK